MTNEALSRLAAAGNQVAQEMLVEIEFGAPLNEALNLAVGVLQVVSCADLADQERAVRGALGLTPDGLGLVAARPCPADRAAPRGWAFAEV